MYKELLESVHKKSPLVHNITNYVTVNDCANILLALGASPVMADDKKEVTEITAISNALVINMGTLNERTVESMLLAGKKANEINIPVILDPVGVGASKFRTDTAMRLLKEIKFSVIRGNLSEMKALSGGNGTTKGVDASAADQINLDNIEKTIHYAKALSQKVKAIIAITGAIDLVTDGDITYAISNGHPIMSKISGTGCMLTSIIGGFCAANPEKLLKATATAICIMGLCGEFAYKKIIEQDGGTASFKIYLIDYMSKMNHEMLKAGAKIEIR